jgi:hypothetical protein
MNNMNTRTWLVAVACAIALCPALQSQTITSQDAAKQAGSSAKAKKRTVKQLDGTKFYGLVELTDDYTIRVTNDWGIVRLPIAELDDADFQRYGFKRDRSKDGRFWYERKEALKESEQNPKSKKANSREKSGVEIRLAEISAFQPLIAAYEKTLAAKESEKLSAAYSAEEKTAPFRPMFSQPSFGGQLAQTLSSAGNSGIKPVAGAAGLPSSP